MHPGLFRAPETTSRREPAAPALTSPVELIKISMCRHYLIQVPGNSRGVRYSPEP